jgi:pyruvate,water dikinase
VDSPELLVPLDGARAFELHDVGGKALRLNRMAAAGFRVPRGFCLTAAAHAAFVEAHGLEAVVRAELGRKPLSELRWEEMWDAALRLRTIFLARAVPQGVRAALRPALVSLGAGTSLAVRSSAPREDAAGVSFAGLHESVVGVRGETALLDAVRVVWASLWSDAALLYLAELGADPAASRMAVVIQEEIAGGPSGVAFGVDPREPESRHQVVEAVPGACAGLVDGEVDPDRWILERAGGAVRSYRPGERSGAGARSPVLAPDDLQHLHRVLLEVEQGCGWKPDIEWTGRGEHFHLLQARPVTGPRADADERRWYLGLRPGQRRLRELRRRVADERIPALEADGLRLSREKLTVLDDRSLAEAIDARAEALRTWRQVYRDEFIPLAHGLRALGSFYNDVVRPADAFEFVGLVRGEDLRALRRNRALAALASRLRDDDLLERDATEVIERGEPAALERLDAGFREAFERVRAEHFDLEFAGSRMCERPLTLLKHVLELSRTPADAAARPVVSRDELERRLLAAAGPQRMEEAAEHLALGRLSWRLRDDDNLLLGRVESQLLRALEEAHRRLAHQDRLRGEGPPVESSAADLAAALRHPGRTVVLARADEPRRAPATARPRQLVGQPAAPGMASGPARHVRTPDDLGSFRRGDVLLCDAIQPNMTHLVPLAGGIVERRGGMLIHGAIIARELGVPCVNGVSRLIDDIPDGELVTVDGDLGLVTVGTAEFRLEGVDTKGTRGDTPR